MIRTVFTSGDADVELVDLMPALTEYQKRRWPLPYRSLIRRVRALRGVAEMELEFVPCPDYGGTKPRLESRGRDSICAVWGNRLLQLRGTVPLQPDGSRASRRFIVRAGATEYFALGYSEDAPAVYPNLGDQAEQEMAWTLEYWRDWLAEVTYSGPFREAVRVSALALKLLAFAPSGAIVAAPTTSLPEVIGGDRNWDYRYCWLRDAAYAAMVFYGLGIRREADSFVQWLLHATHLTHPELKVVYDVYGETPPDRILDHLRGHRDSRPVRVGNGARNQFQLDVYGETLDAVGCFQDFGGALDRDARRLVAGAANFVAKHWAEPDHGIWEMQSGRAQHVHGKIMAWLALDRACAIAHKAGMRAPVDVWARVHRQIRGTVLERGYNPELGAFTMVLGGDRLDASILAVPSTGFFEGDEAPMVSTIRAVQRGLSKNGLVYRYRDVADGLSGREGAFLPCSFWLVESLARCGQMDEAHELMRGLAARANDLGLYSEEMDPDTGEFLGNFPQALTHIALIGAALALARAESSPRGRFGRDPHGGR